MASRRMETKPVITCLKTLLIIYSFVFWPCLLKRIRSWVSPHLHNK
uniref:Tetraspanin 7 n=1 Tax=Homo sapiens TaxID=9606 RepID=F8WC96_HUMAN